MPNKQTNDWPAEVQGLRRIPRQEAESLVHQKAERDGPADREVFARQLRDDKGHPAEHLRERDEDD